ncbi:MAG TPA: carboxylesterase/lipase family protein [Thermoanaerobaculia bacterium]|nr:carboxylesterase/lipase family protein [Thermoanaerobaculia bacterium]
MSESTRGFTPEVVAFDRRRLLKSGAALTVLGAVGGPGFVGRALRARTRVAEPIASTTSGKVRGLVEEGVYAFKGIPYGASTAGANRFRRARPPEPWSSVRDAFDYGPAAPQPPGRIRREEMSEDCLVLNVWTRGLDDGGRRPVMLWLHGGGFSTLSSSSALYDGVNLCQRGDVVVLGLNHRLNVFGFLHLGDVAGPRYSDSGNVGMLDIVHALEWIRDNIESFGGDPHNVTIFGESGGGRKVSTLLAMPEAKGLFHRAIIQSGPGLHLQPRDKADVMSRLLLEELGLEPEALDESGIERLQQLPIDDLVTAYRTVEQRLDSRSRTIGRFEQRGFVPTVGTDALPDYAFDPVASELSAEVPILIGSNRHEMAYFARLRDREVYERKLTEAQLEERVRDMAGSAAERVLEVYRRLYPDADPSLRWMLMQSDRTYRFDSITLAQRKASAGRAPCWMYLFAWESPVDEGRALAHHALEISFAFDNTTRAPEMSGGGPEAAALAAKVSSAWIAFARNGDPSTGSLPDWPPYAAPRRATMVFDDACSVVEDPDAEIRKLWATV